MPDFSNSVTASSSQPQENLAQTIVLMVNGQTHNCLLGTTLPKLLTQLGMNPRLVAVEYNGEILHRQFWDQTQIQADDRLEVVTIVGGG